MRRKILTGILIVGLVGSLALTVILALAYFEELDRSAGVARQYLSETEEDIEALAMIRAAVSTSNSTALSLLDRAIQTHSNRLDVTYLGEAYRNK